MPRFALRPRRWAAALHGLAVGLVLLQAQGLRAQRNLDFTGFLPYAQRLSDVWGHTAEDGTEYALVGAFDGLSIVSLADPTAPVEVQFVPGPASIWRDIKTWEGHAYVTNETGGGLLIVDLAGLPGSVDTAGYTGRGLSTAHNLYIDENGRAYLFGANVDGGGATMLDLTADPMAPVFVGAYDARYVHDGFARGDTLWNGEVYTGTFSVVDVSDPSAPVVLAAENTPTGYTHSAWLSPDGATLAIAEEIPTGLIATYDVTDLTDIRLAGRYRSNWTDSVIPHNTFYRGDWLVNSVYFDGVTLVDASRPANPVETGRFDTSPLPPASGFGGCWGVYPYFPSGLIAATDIEEGLFILDPDYRRAAWLEGTVRDQDGAPRRFAVTELLGTVARPVVTDFTGAYATGTADSGTFTLRVTASGCATGFFPVDLVPGQVTAFDPVLSCSTTAVTGPSAEGPRLALSPVPWTGTTTLAWDLGPRWRANATVEAVDARGRVVLSAPLATPSGRLETGGDWAAGWYAFTVRSGGRAWRLTGVRSRAP